VFTNGKSVNNESLSTAKSTAIIEQFDFETIESLTWMYQMQDILVNKSLNGIGEAFFERELHQIENLDSTIRQFIARFTELTSQERYLIGIYEEVSQKLD
jgi:hypothetical protein